MKRFGTAFIALGMAAAVLSVLPASVSADSIMTMRLSADRTAITAAELANGDAVIHGGMYIDNYTGLNSFRVILNSDSPIVIENGDFTRVEGEFDEYGDPQLAFFKKYSSASYVQESLIDDSKNIAHWVGPDDNDHSDGEVYHADSSVLSLDFRIPKDTPAGDYRYFISTERKETSGGLVSPDFFAFAQRGELKAGRDILLEPVTFSVYTRGDVNCDGKISVDDAQYALNHYVAVGVSGTMPEDDELAELLGTASITAARLAADTSENGEFSIDDVQSILMYATESLTGLTPDWDSYFK